MRKCVFLVLVTITFCCLGQGSEHKAVVKTVHRLFDAMRDNDSTLLKQSFVAHPQMFTALTDSSGASVLITGDFQRFKNAVGQAKDQAWNEVIWNEKVMIDGNLASVWTDYIFYLGDQLSHCGVNVFHLISKPEGWKIFHLVDTRRTKGCRKPGE